MADNGGILVRLSHYAGALRRRRNHVAVAHNVLWNWAGMGASILTGFIIAPFLVHRLGDTVYGLWILIASLTGYFGLLDLGVRGSVGRYIAYYRAKDDSEGINQIINTAVAILCAVAGIALLATLVVCALFFHLFHVPADQVLATRLALVIVGVNLAITFPVTIFDGTLWGFERFDRLNAVDIPMTVTRAGLTMYFVGHGHGLVALALITFFSTAAAAVAKGIISFRINPAMRLGIRYISREASRKLFGYGIWHFLLSVSRQINRQIGSAIIGAVLREVALVTPYSIALRLMGYASQFVVACTGVLTPLTTALHAKERHKDQQRLFLLGGRYCLAFSLFFVTLFLFLGHSVIRLWMGPKLAATSTTLLIVAAVGEALPMGQWLTYSMILGMARHKLSAIISFIEGATAVTLAVLLGRRYGLVGVCAAFAIAGTVFRGLFQIVYGCYLVRLSIWRYLAEALLPAVAAAAVPAAGLWAATNWRQPGTWPQMFSWVAAYGLAYAAVAGVVLGGCHWRERRQPTGYTEAIQV